MRNCLLRRICCLSAAFLLLFSLCACDQQDSVVPTGCLRINGEDVEVDWVVKVDDVKISADEYRYFFMNIAFDMLAAVAEDDGEADSTLNVSWTDEENETALTGTLEYILLNRALFVLADEYGLSLTDADLTGIDEAIIAAKAEYDDEESFLSGLADNYITPEYYPILLQSTAIQKKLSEHLTGENGLYAITEDEMVEKVCNEYVCLRLLSVPKTDDNGADNRALAESYAEKATDATSLIDLINRYSADTSSKNNGNGVYLSLGQGYDAVYQVAAALQPGEISGLFETSEYYNILLRLPSDKAYISTNAEVFINSYQSNIVSKLLSDTAANLSVTYNDAIYAEISLESMD